MYKNKYEKYKLKYENMLDGGLIRQDGIRNILGAEKLEFYNYSLDQDAGEADNIWPLVKNFYIKNNLTIGVKGVNFKYKIIANANNRDKFAPLHAMGMYTAIYKLQNAKHKNDNTKYILRLYERDTTINNLHLFDTEKIRKEYNLFNKYLIKIYHYGSTILENKSFDYIITKEYNVVEYDNYNSISNLTNKNKFKFLYNNVKMLYDLQKNNMFHGDYKIENIGWDENMNIVLIDYDYDTLQEVSKNNKTFRTNRAGYVYGFNFSTTLTGIPKYIGNKKISIMVPISEYNKYSVGGLANIIDTLNIKSKKDIINVPIVIDNKLITLEINNENSVLFAEKLSLYEEMYNSIFTYDIILNILDYLANNNFIKDISKNDIEKYK